AGDHYVDWIEFSLYTIPYSHGELKLGGNRVDYLRPLYDRYEHKPMMISECAISFYSVELDHDFTDWTVHQLDNMYAYLPRFFPQMKAITYFNLDKMTTNYDNQNNNYDLSAREELWTSYNKLIRGPRFVSKVREHAQAIVPLEYEPI